MTQLRANPVAPGSAIWSGGAMDATAVLTAYDEQVRQRPEPDGDGWVERDDRVIRVVSTNGWAGLIWSRLGDLGPEALDARIAGEVARFVEVGNTWEWKYFSCDLPPDLPERLVAAGLTRAEDETLLVAEISELDLEVSLPEGVRLDDVTDAEGIARLVKVHDEVFGGDNSYIGRALATGLAHQPPTCTGVVAMAGEIPVCSGRLELHHGTDFASIWGGGTLPEWRGRGVFRAVVAHRAREAADLGFRYLQVDATADSRPILGRLGFVELATTVPFEHSGRQ